MPRIGPGLRGLTTNRFGPAERIGLSTAGENQPVKQPARSAPLPPPGFLDRVDLIAELTGG